MVFEEEFEATMNQLEAIYGIVLDEQQLEVFKQIFAVGCSAGYERAVKEMNGFLNNQMESLNFYIMTQKNNAP